MLARRAATGLWTVAFLVCPLLFFTNLTRNPYISQIALLNAAVLLSAALWAGLAARGEEPFVWPRTPLDVPLATWAGVALLSWAVAHFGHAAFYRPSIRSEGARHFLFLFANALLPFWLAAECARRTARDEEVALGGWAAFVVVWGLLWTGFPSLRGGGAPPSDSWGLLWDGYGALLWAGGFAGASWLCRKGRWIDWLHLALAAGVLASLYGVCQYFNREFIWPNTINPYGGRAVSTFGNPNFMSSYNVVLLPAAVALFGRSAGGRRLIYALAALALEAGILCSLTRSSWGGALAAIGALAVGAEFRRNAAEQPRPHGLLLAVAAGMALLWPSSSIASGYTPSVLGRLTEVVEATRAGEAYGSWFQRRLIWTCAWLMGSESALLGKGYGLFELFYPFYQGPVLAEFPVYHGMRTHANNGHNEILETFAQTGLLGLGVFFWIWVTFARAAWNSCSRAGGARATMIGALAAGVFGMLVDNLLNVSLHFAVPGFIFWWVAGTTMGLLSPPQAATSAPSPSPAPPYPNIRHLVSDRIRGLLFRSVAVAVCVSCVCLAWVWVRVWNREVHYFAGFKLMRQQQLPAAIRELELSRRWGPREVNAIYELGNAFARSERFPEAIAAYEHALRANAGYDEIFFNVGVILANRVGERERGREFLETAHWINPLAPETLSSLVALYLQEPARHGDKALELLRRALKLDSSNTHHWNNLGYLHSIRQEYDQAADAYSRALTLDPSLSVAEKNLATVAARSKKGAPPLLQALAELRELDARTVRRDYSDATVALAGKLAKQFPELQKARFIHGSLLVARGRAAEAVGPLEWVVARQPGNVFARGNLAEAYLQLGRRDAALAQLRTALSLEPQNEQVRARLKQLGG